MNLSEQEIIARNGRNKAIMWSIIALVGIIFMVTIVKMSGGVN